MSIILTNRQYYHTSYKIIEKVDLSFGKRGNDFGQGFYLTSSETQAKGFVNAAIRKSSLPLDCGYVLAYQLTDIAGLKCFEFEATTAEWLHCICAYRRGLENSYALWEKYDILAGKVANDDTNATISFYLNGAYGEVGSERAIAAALEQLRPDVLEDQICIKTEKASKRLEFLCEKKVAKYERPE